VMAAPAVVQINIEGPRGELIGGGSGFIISKEGLVVTNHHVVDKVRHNQIKVTTDDGRVFSGRVLHADQETDIAIVSFDPRGEDLTVMKIGSSKKLRPGEWVVALGSPFFLRNTVTAGIVSHVARRSRVMRGNAMEAPKGLQRKEFIQTDATMNRGNSGGPLVNLDGEVIGINNWVLGADNTAIPGVGFAIPMDTAWEVVVQLLENGVLRYPYLGMFIDTIRRDKTKPDQPAPDVEGVFVVSVEKNSPAGKGGVLAGDIITQCNGKKVKSNDDIYKEMGLTIGKRLDLEILRWEDDTRESSWARNRPKIVRLTLTSEATKARKTSRYSKR